MVRKVCMSCLLVSNNHSYNCKRCNYDEFATIDDYIDQGWLNSEIADYVLITNKIVEKLIELGYSIKLVDANPNKPYLIISWL